MTDGQENGVLPIFHKDPEEWMQYVYKKVSVVTEELEEIVGWVYTIDPVSESVVLVNFLDDSKRLHLIMGHSVKCINVLSDDMQIHKAELDQLFRQQEVELLPEEDMRKKQAEVKAWLEKYRLPVELCGVNEELLSVSEALIIEPPYRADNCRSSNEIILGRIQGLLKNMPDELEL